MNQETKGNNRFIFSDDFYDNIEDSFRDTTEKEDEKPPVIEEKKPLLEKANYSFLTNPEIVFPDRTENNAYQELKPISFIESKREEPKQESVFVESYINPMEENKNNLIETEKRENQVELTQETFNDKNSSLTPFSQEKIEVQKEDPVEEEKIDSSFQVDTGIDTDLEQQLLRKEEENPSISIENNFIHNTPRKNVYRAIRNSNLTVPNWDQEESILKSEIKNQEKTSPTMMEQEVFPTPKVVNIDAKIKEERKEWLQKEDDMYHQENLVADPKIVNNNLLEELSRKEKETGKISILARYGEDFCSKDYITNPAIGREKEMKELSLILLTPEKSAILVGKPGIGKTSIVEGIAYQIQRNNVPDLLKEYRIISIKTTSLMGTLPNGEARLQTLIDELKDLDHIILFMDEIHMLIGATNEYGLDFANMFKESLGRGSIKMIGATTSDEYERYVLRDKAFVRRFQRVDVLEPTREQTIKILMGTLPKIEKNTNAKLKYSPYIQSEIMAFIVDITTEYKRVYGIGSRYPDICLTLLAQAFSQAIFHNRKEVTIFDVRNAIENSKNIYPDVIQKELINFDKKFKQIIEEEK